MKKLFLLLVMITVLTSCHNKGDSEKVAVIGDSIELFRYYYNDNNGYVFISKFKDEPRIKTITENQSHGKYTETVGNIVIFENDEIKVVKKEK